MLGDIELEPHKKLSTTKEPILPHPLQSTAAEQGKSAFSAALKICLVKT
jgi:hypothetical protein